MKVSFEEKKAEAIKRMKLLKIYPETIAQFEMENLISVSEPPFGAFFWADNETRQRIDEFEKKTDSLVYMVIRSYTTVGKMDSYLFVSDYKNEEWEMDRDDIAHGQVLAYVYNYDVPEFSEFGAIGIQQTIAAGLRRVW